MKEFKIIVPDHQASTLLEFIEYLNMESSVDHQIPDSQKAVVRERIRTSTQESYLPWDEAAKRLKS
jgi:hypothetical protein